MENLRTCLITGASRGIGAETASALAAAGWQVLVGHRGEAGAAEARVAEITAAGGQARAVRADVTRRDDLDALCAALTASGTRLDAVVCNAVAPFRRAPTSKLAWEPAVRAQLDTSAAGFLNTVQCLLPALSREAVLMPVLTSALTVHDGADTAAYLAGKGALLGLCQGWQRELAAAGRRLVLVSPGATQTDLLLGSAGDHPRQRELLAQTLARSGAATPAEMGAQLARIVASAAAGALPTGGPTPLHLIVDRASVRRLTWTLEEIAL
jgi:3-oxoacyl-[acyl-carrier protein] reductase